MKAKFRINPTILSLTLAIIIISCGQNEPDMAVSRSEKVAETGDSNIDNYEYTLVEEEAGETPLTGAPTIDLSVSVASTNPAAIQGGSSGDSDSGDAATDEVSEDPAPVTAVTATPTITATPAVIDSPAITTPVVISATKAPAAIQDEPGLIDAGLPAVSSEPGIATFNRSAFIWKGLDHEWLRTVVGFRVPHRISTLSSYVSGEEHAKESSWLGSADFTMAQNTGVDGNFMDPRGFYNAVNSDKLYVTRGYARIQWTDNGDGGTYPKAKSSFTQNLSINLNTSKQNYGNLDNYIAVLRGIKMEINCDDSKQGGAECNSNGMWPYRYYISLNSCSQNGNTLDCDLDIDIYRAWTPEKGGLQPFETKPFDDRLDFDLRVYYTVFGGDDGYFNYKVGSEFNRTGMLRDDAPKTGTKTIYGAGGYSKGTTALTAIGFELSKHTNKKKHNHLGRYIGSLYYKINDDSYTASNGRMAYDYTLQTWAPDTVHNSDIEYFMQVALLQFDNGAQLSGDKTVTGEICQNSKDNAPFFSKWQKCGSGDKGPAQQEDTRTIYAP